jgi:hypothetical protein
MDKLLETLDSLFFEMRNVKVNSLELYRDVIPSIIRRLESVGCRLHSKRYYVDFDEITLIFSCNDDKSCAYVTIKMEVVSLDLERIRVDYHLLGANCDEWISFLRRGRGASIECSGP